MDFTNKYYDIYSVYQSELRPLIAKVEASKEAVPDDLFQLVALMFDNIALFADSNRRDDEAWVRRHLTEAKEIRDKAFIKCYQLLISDIEDRVSRCLIGHSENEQRLIPPEFIALIDEARYSRQRAMAGNDVEKYKTTYEKYIVIDNVLDNEPYLETTSRDLKKETRNNMWMYEILIPIIVGVVIGLILFLYPIF